MTVQLVVLALLSCLLGAFLFHFVTSQWARFVWWRRLRRGERGELKAEKLLRKRGFRIRSVQQEISSVILINGKEIRYKVRPDAIVSRGKRIFVVEVKTGETAPNPLYGETRRQLLEYQVAAPVDGVLLVNPEAQRIQQIDFPEVRRVTRTPRIAIILSLLLGSIIGFGLTYLFLL